MRPRVGRGTESSGEPRSTLERLTVEVARAADEQNVAELESVTLPLWRYAKDGFLIVFLNPKIMIFFLAVFSQFLTPEQSLFTQFTAATLASVIDGLWYALVAVLVSWGRENFGIWQRCWCDV